MGAPLNSHRIQSGRRGLNRAFRTLVSGPFCILYFRDQRVKFLPFCKWSIYSPNRVLARA